MRLSTLLLLASATAAGAQVYAPNARGTFKQVRDNINTDVPTAQAQQGLKAADTLLAILKQTELFRNPIGVNIEARRLVTVQDGDWNSGRPYSYGVEANVSLLVKSSTGAGVQSGPMILVQLLANDVSCVPGTDSASSDGGPPVSDLIGVGARITGEFRGHSVYDGNCLQLTGHAGSPIVPVTKERYMRILIADVTHRGNNNRASMQGEASSSAASSGSAGDRPAPLDCAQLAAAIPDAATKKTAMDQCKQANAQMAAQWAQAQKDAKSNRSSMDGTLRDARQLADSGLNARARELHSQLAAMSPAERRRQAAVFLDRDGNRLSDVDSIEALPLVQFNAGFFDRTTPPNVPQVISVSMPGLQDGVMPFGFGDGSNEASVKEIALGRRIRDQINWAALEALVRRNAK